MELIGEQPSHLQEGTGLHSKPQLAFSGGQAVSAVLDTEPLRLFMRQTSIAISRGAVGTRHRGITTELDHHLPSPFSSWTSALQSPRSHCRPPLVVSGPMALIPCVLPICPSSKCRSVLNKVPWDNFQEVSITCPLANHQWTPQRARALSLGEVASMQTESPMPGT